MSDTSSHLWATFILADEMFAVRAEDVQEVLWDQPLTPVPMAPTYIAGLINLRGQIVPAVDLRRRLHFPDSNQAARHMLVLKLPDGWVSIMVDNIGDVLSVEEGSWQPPPDTLAAVHRRLVDGVCPIDHHMLTALNVAALPGDDVEPAAAP